MRRIPSLLASATLVTLGLFSSTAFATDAVLIELFTSQGCSSCPPADALLSNLGEEGEREIIPLSYHVDYWNSLGWKDGFSSPEWSKRQRGYAALSSDRTYTPQLVVQGSVDCLGSDERCIRAAIEQAREQRTAGTVRVLEAREADGSLVVEAMVMLREGHRGAGATVVVYESGLSTEVRRGENRGRTLRNDFVVRALRETGTVGDCTTSPARVTARIPIQNDWQKDKLGVVVFLQERESRRVLAVDRVSVDASTDAAVGQERAGKDRSELKPLGQAERVPADQVALGGHCPVALSEGAGLVPGSPELQYRYQGVVYQVANQAAGSKFASQPARYVPTFSSFHPIVRSETREKTTDSLGVFAVQQGSRPWFFLNTDGKNKSLLRRDPEVPSSPRRSAP